MKHRTRHRVTLAGMIFAGIALFVMIAAINSQTNLLFWAFGLMLGGLIFSSLISFVMLRHLEVRRVLSDHVVAGEPALIHYVLTNPKGTWPAFAVQVREANYRGVLTEVPDGYCLHIGPRESCTLATQLVAPRRGIVELRDMRVSSAFPFGFLSHAHDFLHSQQMVVYPRIGLLNRQLATRYREAITAGTMTSSVRGGQDEFYGVREYRPGDNVRAIHWKRTAHTGEVVVREMTANAPPQMVVVLNLRGWRDAGAAEAVERAIELAASLLCYGSVENFAIGLLIAGLPEQPPVITQMGRDARARALHALAIIDPSRLDPAVAIPMPNRLARRAEWIIVTLRGADETRDLVPPGASATLMALDDPEAGTWLHFLGSSETLKALRMDSGQGG